MARIYLVRHATPRIEPGVPSERWELSPAGIEDARRLADVAKAWGLRAVYCSAEPKAAATALIVADACGLLAQQAEGIEEQRWPAWIDNADEFNAAVRRALEEPDASVRGAETASDAATRFGRALALVCDGPAPAAVVSHGRAVTAYLAQAAALDDPYEFWRAIPMPGYAQIEVAGDARRARIIAPFVGVPAEE